MPNRFVQAGVSALVAVLLVACAPAPPPEDDEAAFVAPRTPDGDPDLNGI